jgi:hypothetical protein
MSLAIIALISETYLNNVYHVGVSFFAGIENLLKDSLINNAAIAEFIDIALIDLLLILWIFLDSRQLKIYNWFGYIVILMIMLLLSAAGALGLYLAIREWHFMRIEKAQ